MTQKRTSRRSKRAAARRVPTGERFSHKRTASAGGLKLFRNLIGNNHVSCTVPAPCTHRDVVEQIARKSQPVIPIDLLSPELSKTTLPRGRTIFGSPWERFDNIARNYQNLFWWISEKGLRMEVISEPDQVAPTFEQIAGKLMFEARERRLKNGRLPEAEYKTIADQLGKFKILEHLPRKYRNELGPWNQNNQTRAIHTCSAALEAKNPRWLRRQVLRCLYRAEDKFRAARR